MVEQRQRQLRQLLVWRQPVRLRPAQLSSFLLRFYAGVVLFIKLPLPDSCFRHRFFRLDTFSGSSGFENRYKTKDDKESGGTSETGNAYIVSRASLARQYLCIAGIDVKKI
ncbi:MAG: hypothetical protein A2939_04305 [Parcubacteria group bacterium RIFCSPLOWO2_01_FULL_48_18]|nr:MAG: hypothetical protein A2939_04305 [Parcubacteria group bacterium RIFCSPLOWO2_01_FULL_48_18]